MLGRIVGLLLGLGLGGLAYVILYPGGLQGQVPVLDLGAFESVRLGVALAAGLAPGLAPLWSSARTANGWPSGFGQKALRACGQKGYRRTRFAAWPGFE